MLWTRFSAEGYIATLPTKTFSGEQTIHVGSKEIRFIEVGPAHTKGGVVVYVPEDKTVFAGDILFMDGHPIVWDGPVQNWIDACDLMMSREVDTVVPGHGPITDKQGIQGLKDYLLFVRAESRKRFDAGMAYGEAGRDIDPGAYADWIDRERIVLNVYACYREFDDEIEEVDRIELLSAAGLRSNPDRLSRPGHDGQRERHASGASARAIRRSRRRRRLRPREGAGFRTGTRDLRRAGQRDGRANPDR